MTTLSGSDCGLVGLAVRAFVPAAGRGDRVSRLPQQRARLPGSVLPFRDARLATDHDCRHAGGGHGIQDLLGKTPSGARRTQPDRDEIRERPDVDLDGQRTGLRELGRAIFRNDQLLWTATAFLLFMLGYGTTGAFGFYFFKYAYGDEKIFPVFALCVGVGQIAGLISFPWFARRWSRRTLYGWATGLIRVWSL